MKVICAGLSKTGTTSLARALRRLGFTVYDWMEHENIHGDEWLDIYYGGKALDFASMYKDVDAVTDLPAAFWFQEIYEAFPNAKVILTIRDSEDVWARSWAKQREVDDFEGTDWLTKIVLRYWLHRKYYALLDAEDSAAFGILNSKSTVLFKKKYREHNERVQAVIPKEKLLIFNVKQGWEPLCKFLGCDIPEQEPFPWQNVGTAGSSERLAKRRQKLRFNVIAILATLCVLFIALYFFGL
ncbi:uncharacterized protein LOC144635256 [Oculina patagonica]